MREFALPLTDALVNGLRPRADLPDTAPYLRSVANMRLSEVGAQPLTFALGAVASATPYLLPNAPSIAFFGGQAYSFDVAFGTLTALPLLTVRGAGSGAMAGSVHMAGNDKSWVMSCASQVLLCQAGSFARAGGLVWEDTTPVFTSVVEHKSRMVCAGFSSNPLPFEVLALANKARADAGMITEAEDNSWPSYVLWGSVGGGDFPFWFYDPPVLSSDEWLENLQAGEWGTISVPEAGTIVGLGVFGDFILVQGVKKCVILRAFAGGDNIAPGYGIFKVLPVTGSGVSCQVSGVGLVFEDRAGKLYLMNGEGQVGQLYFGRDVLPGGPTRMYLGAKDGELYVCRGTRTMLLSLVGERPNASVGTVNGGPVYHTGGDFAFLLTAAQNVTEYHIETHFVAPMSDGEQSLNGVQLSGFRPGTSSVWVRLWAEYADGVLRASAPIRVNAEGRATGRVVGRRYVIKVYSATPFSVAAMTALFQLGDRRHNRSVNVNSLAG